DVVKIIALYRDLGERDRAHDLAGACLAALETMDSAAWAFKYSFTHVARAVAELGDDRIDRLCGIAIKIKNAETASHCDAELAIALTECGRHKEASQFARRSLDQLLAMNAKGFSFVRYTAPRLVEALASTKDRAGLFDLRKLAEATASY